MSYVSNTYNTREIIGKVTCSPEQLGMPCDSPEEIRLIDSLSRKAGQMGNSVFGGGINELINLGVIKRFSSPSEWQASQASSTLSNPAKEIYDHLKSFILGWHKDNPNFSRETPNRVTVSTKPNPEGLLILGFGLMVSVLMYLLSKLSPPPQPQIITTSLTLTPAGISSLGKAPQPVYVIK